MSRSSPPARSRARGPTQSAVIETLAERGELTSRQAGEAIGKSPVAAASALHRLFDRGVVARRPNPSDPVGYLYRIEDDDGEVSV